MIVHGLASRQNERISPPGSELTFQLNERKLFAGIVSVYEADAIALFTPFPLNLREELPELALVGSFVTVTPQGADMAHQAKGNAHSKFSLRRSGKT